MSLSSLPKLLASLSFFACSSLFAAPVVINVTGIQSYGELGDPANTVFEYQVGANATITSVSYSINVTAFSPSWLSEIAFAITDSGVTDGVLFTPGFEDEFAGTASYSDSLVLAEAIEDLTFNVGADGILRVEFYEDIDDGAVNPDGRWNSGTITITYDPDLDVPVDPGPGTDVPEPASALLLGVGALAMGYGRRRRAAKAAH